MPRSCSRSRDLVDKVAVMVSRPYHQGGGHSRDLVAKVAVMVSRPCRPPRSRSQSRDLVAKVVVMVSRPYCHSLLATDAIIHR